MRPEDALAELPLDGARRRQALDRVALHPEEVSPANAAVRLGTARKQLLTGGRDQPVVELRLEDDLLDQDRERRSRSTRWRMPPFWK
jgi:hypothetical protein